MTLPIADSLAVSPRSATPEAIRVLVMLGGIPLHGQERGNIQVFHALKDAGVDALFVTHEGYGHESIQPALDRLGLKWTVATYPDRIGRGMGPRDWASRLRQIVRGNLQFWRAARAYRPTHVHVCNEGHLLPLLPAVKAIRRPVVFRLGDEPRQHLPVFRQIWRRAFVPAVSRFVCVSEYIREKLIAAGAPPEKTRVIYTYPQERKPLGAEERLGGSAGASGGEARLRELAEVPFRGTTFVYMGQLSEEKGVGLLVEAAMRLCTDRSDVRFLIAGDYVWQNPFAQGLMRKVEEGGLADRVWFLGYVEDVPGLLALADVHVCPSVWEEPLSNTVVEAKRAGVPSIVFPSGGLPEIVADGEDGTVTREKTAEALFEAFQVYADFPPDELTRRKHMAAGSLERLGVTREAFIRAWRAVYAE